MPKGAAIANEASAIKLITEDFIKECMCVAGGVQKNVACNLKDKMCKGKDSSWN